MPETEWCLYPELFSQSTIIGVAMNKNNKSARLAHNPTCNVRKCILNTANQV